MSLPVIAIDNGYGNTKFAWRDAATGNIKMDVFRSIAEAVPVKPETFEGVKVRDTFYVDIANQLFQVGKDIGGAATASLVLNPDYPQSAQYMALTLGALAYIHEATGATEIGKMVLGLPVSTFQKHREMLRARFQGGHRVPTRSGGTVTMHVDSIKVIPQPAGSYLAWRKMANAAGEAPPEGTVLMLDPGEYTIDWLLVDDGRVIHERSGAVHLGMSEIHKYIATQFERDHGESDINHELIRKGLMAGVATFRGEQINFTDYIRTAKAKARAVVDQLLSKTGPLRDVSCVVVTGGGAKFFEEAIKAKLAIKRVELAKEPLYGNVYGFYLAGQT